MPQPITAWHAPRWSPADLVPPRLGRCDGLSTAEIARRAVIRVGPAPHRADRTATVLVGGAGFLGTRIVKQLLAEPGDQPVVVVSRRPETVLRHCPADKRLVLVAADLAAADWSWMRRIPRADVIFHLAASVHALAGWHALAPVNLAGLAASVALAGRDDAVLQLASTLSVYVSSNAEAADGEGTLPESDAVWLYGGYAQTKAAAEFALARMTSLRWQVVRYGLLVPEPGDAFPARHFAAIFCRALLRLGLVPDPAEQAAVDLTPVDGAAAAAIRLAREAAPCWRHWANPVAAPLSEVVAAIEAARGPLARCSRPEWLGRLQALPRIERTLLRAAFDKSGFLADQPGGLLNVDLFQATGRRFIPAGPLGDAPPPPGDLLPGFVQSMLAEAAPQ